MTLTAGASHTDFDIKNLFKQQQETLNKLVGKVDKSTTKTKATDPFVSALEMAIINDNKIDSKEIDYLQNLIKRSSENRKAKKRARKKRSPLFELLYNGSPLFRIWHATRKKPRKKVVKQKPSFPINHNVREAFKLAALDGVITKAEITALKKLF